MNPTPPKFYNINVTENSVEINTVNTKPSHAKDFLTTLQTNQTKQIIIGNKQLTVPQVVDVVNEIFRRYEKAYEEKDRFYLLTMRDYLYELFIGPSEKTLLSKQVEAIKTHLKQNDSIPLNRTKQKKDEEPEDRAETLNRGETVTVTKPIPVKKELTQTDLNESRKVAVEKELAQTHSPVNSEVHEERSTVSEEELAGSEEHNDQLTHEEETNRNELAQTLLPESNFVPEDQLVQSLVNKEVPVPGGNKLPKREVPGGNKLPKTDSSIIKESPQELELIEEFIDKEEAQKRKDVIERKIKELEALEGGVLEETGNLEPEIKEINTQSKPKINLEAERNKLITNFKLEVKKLTPTDHKNIRLTLSHVVRKKEKERLNALLEAELEPKLPRMNKNIINRTFAELINENKEIIKIINNFSKNCIEIPENFTEDDLIKALKIFEADIETIENKFENNIDNNLTNDLINYLQYCKFKNIQPEIESNDISRLITFMRKQNCIYRNSRKLLREQIKNHKKLIIKMMEVDEKKPVSGNYDDKSYIFLMSIDAVVAKHGVACYEWSHQMSKLKVLEGIFSSRIKKISASNTYLKQLEKPSDITT